MVLTQAGSRLLGLLAVGMLLDELFLTVSLVWPTAAAPPARADRTEPAEQLTLRRHRSYLFLRYAMRGVLPAADPGGG